MTGRHDTDRAGAAEAAEATDVAAGADLLARIRSSFTRQGMMASIGADLVRVAPGAVTIRAPVTARHGQQQGFAHGGLVFALGDSAAGYAALSLLPPDSEVMTAEMKIHFLSPAAGTLVAEGRVLRAGRRLVVAAADVWDEDATGHRRQAAVLLGTMIPVRP